MNGYLNEYDPDNDFDSVFTKATATLIAARMLPAASVLDLGCATGLMAAELAERGPAINYVGLDHSEEYLETARAKQIPGATFQRADLNELDAFNDRYDHVLLTNIIHEVDSPTVLLNQAARLLGRGGQIHVTLQNPASVHRLVALELGMISSLETISERGQMYSTRRMINQGQLVTMVANSGLSVQETRGVFLKPFPNSVLEGLEPPMIEALDVAGRFFPENCAMNYVRASN